MIKSTDTARPVPVVLPSAVCGIGIFFGQLLLADSRSLWRAIVLGLIAALLCAATQYWARLRRL